MNRGFSVIFLPDDELNAAFLGVSVSACCIFFFDHPMYYKWEVESQFMILHSEQGAIFGLDLISPAARRVLHERMMVTVRSMTLLCFDPAVSDGMVV